MRKLLLIAVLGVLVSASAASAGTYYFRPWDSGGDSQPSDLSDLDHYYHYTWGINWSVPSGQVIQGMELYIHQIDDWTNETGDRLYIHFLNSVPDPAGSPNYFTPPSPYNFYQTITLVGWDNQNGGDAFGTQGWWVDPPYTDPGPGTVDLTYIIPSAYWGYVEHVNGNFGFGFDPDCHYYNQYIELRITTAPPKVPEPATLLLLGFGLVGLAGMRRRFGR